MPGEIKATPQQSALGAFARLLKGREELQQRVPSMTGTILDLLLPTSETVEKWSYGETPIRINLYAGRTASYIPEIRDPAYALETASFLPLVSPAARATSKAANTLGDVAVRAITRNPAATSTGVLREAAAMSPLSSVVKPKGGAGWLAGELSPKTAVSRFRDTSPYGRTAAQYLNDLETNNPATYHKYLNFVKNVPIDSLKSRSADEMHFELANMWREKHGEPPLPIDKPDEAVNKWVETKLAKYVTNEMATPEDPLRKLAEENILHYQPLPVFPNSRVADTITASRELTGNPIEGLGQSELARRWEDAADYGITPMTARDRLHDLEARRTISADAAIEQNPWLKQVDPKSMTYTPDAYAFIQSTERLGFPHMVDELRNAVDPQSTLPAHLRLTPKQLENLEMPNAVKLVDKINKYRAAEAVKAEKAGMMANLQAEPRLTNPDFQLEFVDKPGATWINIPETVDEKGTRLCTTVGKQGGWCTMDEPRAKEYGSGRNRLVAMIDADGRPHLQATISQPSGTTPSHWMNILPEEEQIKILESGITPGDLPEYKEWLAQRPANITEFKPPGNSFDSDRAKKYAERDPEYKKKIDNAVLDFLNSQQWGTVSDIDRYGIIDIQNPDHVIRQIDGMFGSKNRQAGIDAFNAAVDEDPMAPRFMKRGDFVQFLEPYSPVDGKAKGGPVKMAKGGPVKMGFGGLLTKYSVDQPALQDTAPSTIPDQYAPTYDPNLRNMVTQAYNDILQRAPEQAGSDYWTQQLATGALKPEDLYSNITAAAQGADVSNAQKYATALQNTNLVKQAYKDILQRDPEQEGLSYWTNQLNTNALAPQDLYQNVLTAAQGADRENADRYAQNYYNVVQPSGGGSSGGISRKTLDDLASAYSIANFVIPGFQAVPLVHYGLKALSLGNTVKSIGKALGFAEGGAISDADVKRWIMQRPEATDADIVAAMQRYNVTPQQVARVTPLTMTQTQKRYDAALPLVDQNAPPRMFDIDVKNWLSANPKANDYTIAPLMQKYNVTPEQVSRVTGVALPEIESRYALARPKTDEEVKQWLTANQGLGDAELASSMRHYNVTPEQVSRVTGVPLNQVTQRYIAATPGLSQNGIDKNDPWKDLSNIASAYSMANFFIPGFQAAPLVHYGLKAISTGNTIKKIGDFLGFAEGGAVEYDPDEISSLAEELMKEQPATDIAKSAPITPERLTSAAEQLQLREGPLSARPVRGARGDYIGRLAADVAPGAQVFADVDPWRRMLAQYGVQYVHPLPGGAASAELVFDPVNQARVLSGAYRQQLDKDSELSARGAYIQGQSGRPDYNVQLQYRKRFAEGGTVKYDPTEIDALAAQLQEEFYG